MALGGWECRRMKRSRALVTECRFSRAVGNWVRVSV